MYNRICKIVLLAAAFLFCAVSAEAAERNYLAHAVGDASFFKKNLLPQQSWIAYPDYTDRRGWNDLFGDYKPELIRSGEARLTYKWRPILLTEFLEYQRSGSRVAVEKPIGENNSAFVDLVLAELAEGKGRFLDQIANGIFFFCEQTTWSNSAHLMLQTRSGNFPDWRENVIELGSSQLASLLSWTHYFLRDSLDGINPVICERLREEIRRRIMNRYLSQPHFWWMGFRNERVNNWNPWCNFNVLQCFLLLEDDRDKLSETLWTIVRSLDKFINCMPEDGACDEGASYWRHAAGKMYDCLELLGEVTGGKLSIFSQPLIRRLGEYITSSYVGNGWVVNFADAQARMPNDAAVIYRYGKAVGSRPMVEMGVSMYRSLPFRPIVKFDAMAADLYRSLYTFRSRPALDAESGIEFRPVPFAYYPQTQVCYMSNDSGYFLAAKGGHNDESHNHNDVGSFVLYADEVPYLIDLGVMTYTKESFSGGRYGLWPIQSISHNVPEIDGRAQNAGRKYAASEAHVSQKQQVFSIDISGAYPVNVKGSWIRKFDMDKKQVIVSDEFSYESPVMTRINFMTWGDVDISRPGVAVLTVNGKKVSLSYDPRLLQAIVERRELTDPKLTGIWGDCVYRLSLVAPEKRTDGKYIYIISKYED